MTIEQRAGYIVVDVETTIKNKTIGKNKAFPFHPDNRIVLAGLKVVSDKRGGTTTASFKEIEEPIVIGAPPGDQADVLVPLMIGHNIKFDLHYLRRHQGLIDNQSIRNWLATGDIWDTQSAEYILSGQSHLYPSLDQCSTKYGGTLKDDRIKTLWNAGVDTEDIQTPMLEEYLRHDLDNTDLVFRNQLKAAKANGMLPVIRSMNQAIIAYEEMEYNGMHVDTKRLVELTENNKFELDLVVKELHDMIPPKVLPHINLGSTQQISALLFGGEIKYTVREKVGTYKNGNDKLKNITYIIKTPLYDLRKYTKSEWQLKNGSYQTTDYILEEVKLQISEQSREHQFISLMQAYRTLDKERVGYYESIPQLLCDGDYLHQNINNCATHTGRLSQSDPNLQNTAKKGGSQVKSMFDSRFGTEGFIIEADYKQLEVIAIATLSADNQLNKDLIDGVDIHGETHKKVRHLMPTHINEEDQRRKVKAVNFGLLYGGGAKTLAKQSGLEVSVVKAIIKAFFQRYPGVKDYQENQVRRLEFHQPNGKTEKGYPRRSAKIVSLTERQYTFNEYDAPPWLRRSKGIDVDFSYTQMCNYEGQGFATGDIVPTVAGVLYRVLMADPLLKDNCLIINTVHDSIIFDCRGELIEHAAKVIKETMEDVPKIMKEVYGLNLDLPFYVDVKAGPNWKQQWTIEDLLKEDYI